MATHSEIGVAIRSVADMHRTLLAGFTAVRDLGSKAGPSLGQAVECPSCGVCEIKRAWEESSAMDAGQRRRKLEELKKLGSSGIVRG